MSFSQDRIMKRTQYQRNQLARSAIIAVASLSILVPPTCLGEDMIPTKPKCGIYLAPSSIPGSGLGMYAGDKHYTENELVTMGDAVIPISEYELNNEGGEFANDIFLWDEYTWNAPVFPYMEDEGESESYIMAASPGVGAAANSYITLENVEDIFDVKIGRPVPPESPGTGANTLYHGREFYAVREIPAGAELFVNYGEHYFRGRTSTYGYIPLPDTFEKTDILITRYLRMKEKIKFRSGQSEDKGLWKDLYGLFHSLGSTWGKSRILNGLPDDEENLPTLMREGGSGQKDFNRSIREISWLEENGQCMDNIKPGNSTIPDAGRGAFANRFIPKGGLVAPAPFVHVANYDALKVYRPVEREGFPGQSSLDGDSQPWNYQLLLNYCFGHEQSTLALCPYGLLTAFINHSHKKPNTRIQWTSNMRHPEWREKDIGIWADEFHTGLQIDFVALRDIEEDEEILIDYGASWEAAWQEHVKNYVPIRKNYIPSFEMNQRTDIDYRTVHDADYEVDNLVLYCHEFYLQQFFDDIDGDQECRIIKKLGNDRYMVQLMHINDSETDEVTLVFPGSIIWSLPSNAFYFLDVPYSRDHYLPNVFRHLMMIPDDMFPEVWKNKK